MREKMIPKIIHYCWFGHNPLPPLAIKCIESWKKYLPDYEIRRWDENNFDVNIIAYTREAYRLKKYAFVSDFARFWILYHYGGLYFDTDVEVIRPLDDIIERGPFMGFEAIKEGVTVAPGLGLGCNPGLGLGCNPGLGLYKKVLDKYEKRHYVSWTGRYTGNIVEFVSQILYQETKEVLCDNIIRYGEIFVYPTDYFCPLNYCTNELNITKNTRSIHHYHACWCDKNVTVLFRIKRRVSFFVVRLLSFLSFK